MDLAPPPADSAPVLDPPPSELRPPQPVFGGVAALLAGRLAIDALWIRIAFVLLALVGGVGVLVYGAMWLALVVGQAPGKRWARVTGGALLVFGLPLILTNGFSFFDGPTAVLALLAGLAVALWQPRATTPMPVPATAPVEVAVPVPAPRPERPARPPSILGRLTLGIAVLVAAVGALIDQANGGRLHPEQWLGAAAVVCGVGLVAGAFAGRALWLAVPAVLFAGTGFVAGEAARIGVHPTAVFGDEFMFVGNADPGGVTQREHVAVGRIEVAIDGAPLSPVAIDARVGIGEIDVRVAGDVTVEVRAEVDHGTVDVDGVRRSDGTFSIGPEGAPDVVVTAIIGRGDLEIDRYDPDVERPTIPVPPGPPNLRPLPED